MPEIHGEKETQDYLFGSLSLLFLSINKSKIEKGKKANKKDKITQF